MEYGEVAYGGYASFLKKFEVHDPQEDDVKDLWNSKDDVGTDVFNFGLNTEVSHILPAYCKIPQYFWEGGL